jgi:hypothetical protein
MFDIIAIIITLIVVFHAQNTTTKLWHVLALALTSIVLVLNFLLPQELFLFKNFWVLWTIGIVIGLISFIYSHIYKASFEKKALAKHKQKWDEKFAKEENDERSIKAEINDQLRKKIIENKKEVKATIVQLMNANEDNKLEEFLVNLPSDTKATVNVELSKMQILKVKAPDDEIIAQHIVNYIIDPKTKNTLINAIETYIAKI